MGKVWLGTVSEPASEFFDRRGVTANTVKTPLGSVAVDGFLYNCTTESIASQLVDSVDGIIELLQTINGEYALVAETDSFYVAATDPWKTKNLWIGVSNGTVAIASTPDAIKQSGIHAYPIGPNTAIFVSKHDLTVSKHTVKHWNLAQHATTHSQVFDALEQAVLRRYTAQCVTTLSSGYDSGVIACALSKLGYRNFSVSFKSTESIEVLKDRLAVHGGKILPETGKFTDDEINDLREVYLQSEIFSPAGEAIGRVCRYMNTQQKTCILAGNSGDELYSDYGYFGRQLGEKSLFGGRFPEQLTLVWPWHDYLYRQSGLVSRLDLIAGYYGVQHKEPLLDIDLVQAWLNTSAELKNRRYKNWMYEYMCEHKYPVLVDAKIGFNNSMKKII